MASRDAAEHGESFFLCAAGLRGILERPEHACTDAGEGRTFALGAVADGDQVAEVHLAQELVEPFCTVAG